MEQEHAGARIVYKVLAVLPLLLLIGLVLKYKVNVPQVDDWSFIPLIEKSYSGTLTLRDLWAQHGAHRLFFSNALLLLFVRWTHWDVTAPLLLGIGLAAGAFVILSSRLKAALKAAGDSEGEWLIPVLSLFLFSASQYQNWLWEGRIGKLLALCAVVTGIAVLAAPSVFRWGKIGAAWALGVLGTYSYTAGLLFWPIGVWILWNSSFRDGAEKRKALFLWALGAGAVILLYFRHFSFSLGFKLNGTFQPQHPIDYLQYVLVYLGAPLMGRNPLAAAAAGTVGLALFSVLFQRWRRRRFFPLVPYIALGLFSIGSAGITAVGRTPLGNPQAAVSRYIAFGQFLWIADVVLLYFFLRSKKELGRSWLWNPAGALLAGIVFLAAWRSAASLRDFSLHHQKLVSIQKQILDPSRNEELYRRLPSVPKDWIEKGIVILRKRRLSAFAD